MIRSLWTGASGMIAQQLSIDVIANNLANVNTTGFKKSRAEFEDLMYQNLKIAGVQNVNGDRLPTGIQIGLGVRPTDVHKIFTQGDFKHTGNPLDIVIQGDGFFLLNVNGEEAYTRAGAFKPDADNRLVNANGYPLQPEFTIPNEATNFVVTEDGRISALDSAGNELASVDIQIYTFINPAGLKAMGRNLYLAAEGSGDPIEGTPGTDNFGTLAQGYLESSNVELVDEMVSMIVGQRAYEINSKTVTTSDEMLKMAMQLKR
ncbi:MAG: flagellar basal-body rod protein FlgG [Deltaproteobacteria bacterium]|nr:flagellar basal-body rod protein FlgG [Deltaproteobacteria bacterium]